MGLRVLIIVFFVFPGALLFAQLGDNSPVAKHFIEVSGTSETEVIPDEIYITVTLQERNEGKEKVSIEKQEEELKRHIKDLGIEPANLSLARADADYRKIRKSAKDVMISKTYFLKIGSAELLSKVYEKFDRMDVYDAFVSRYTHSKILDLQKENRIKAIKAAKEKVDYLLAAIGQQAGQAYQITESLNYVEDGSNSMPRAAYLNTMQSFNEADTNTESSEISFKKIKIRSSFLVKYEILTK